jgi:Uma2 family endonuclease
VTTAPSLFVEAPADVDRHFVVYGISWETYGALRASFDESQPGLRMTYLEGTLELMSPSREHEKIKTLLGRLLEAWAEESGVELQGAGSTTFRKQAVARGLEPDECYSLDDIGEVPDIAIEVVTSHALVDKLEVYRGLAIPEVWVFKAGALTVYRLRGARYQAGDRSVLLPTLDLPLLASFVRADAKQTATVKKYRAALRG